MSLRQSLEVFKSSSAQSVEFIQVIGVIIEGAVTRHSSFDSNDWCNQQERHDKS